MTTLFEYTGAELDELCQKDETLAAYIKTAGRINRQIDPDAFASLISSIVGQQISNKAFATVWQRFYNLAGEITPRGVAAMTAEQIQSCGMSFRKAGYIKNAADKAVSGEVDFDALREKSDADVIKTLTTLSGVGRWTAEMLLIFSFGRKDVFSAGDFGLRRGAGILYGLEGLADEPFMKELGGRYSPYGSVASLYLWKLSEETGR